MKHFYTKKIALALSVAAFSFATAQYSNGYIVANEGNYGTPNADVSYIDKDTKAVTNNIYTSANNGESLGDVLQHIAFHGDYAYLVVNNSNKVVVVDRSSFQKVAEVSVSQPRYATVANNHLFVTSSTGQSVEVFSLADFSKVKTIALNTTVEKILTTNNKVYVLNAAWGSGDTISVIDPNTMELSKTITLGNGLSDFDTDTAGNLFVYGNGNRTKATIYKINTTTDELEGKIWDATIRSGRKMAVDGGKIFFTYDNVKIGKVDTQLNFTSFGTITSVPDNSWSTFYGFAAIDDTIFAIDASGFTGNSIIYTYTADGTAGTTYTVGRGANGLYKNVYIKSGLSTNENTTSQNALTLYPNPASDVLFVKNANNTPYEIYDATGKLVSKGIYNTEGISVKGLAKGLHLIKIGAFVEKFIVK